MPAGRLLCAGEASGSASRHVVLPPVVPEDVSSLAPSADSANNRSTTYDVPPLGIRWTKTLSPARTADSDAAAPFRTISVCETTAYRAVPLDVRIVTLDAPTAVTVPGSRCSPVTPPGPPTKPPGPWPCGSWPCGSWPCWPVSGPPGVNDVGDA